MIRRHLIAAASLAGASVVLVAPSHAQEPPPVVTIVATDGVLEVTLDCDGNTTTALDPITFTLSRAGDTTEELFVDTSTLGSIESISNVGEGIVIPAGAATVTFQPDTGDQTGTVRIEIANVTFPGTFTVGDPSTATGEITSLVSTPACTEPPTSAPQQPPAPPEPPRAEPQTATPVYTG